MPFSTVPTSAVQISQQGNFVFVVKNGVATVKPIKVDRVIGAETVIESGLEGDETVVTSGLAPGEQVVTVGQLRLAPGSKVSVGRAAEAS